MPLYTPEWETLVDALNRVVAATGVSELQAQTAICHAIADKKIKIRVVVDPKHHPDGGKTFRGGNVGVPPRLDPGDFDWTKSRPLKLWSIGPMPGQHYAWIGGWQDRPISLMELSTADVRDVLCNSATISRSHAHPANPHKTGPRPEKLERVKHEMRRDLQEGRCTELALQNMREKELETKYGASRNTVRKAREQVLSELRSDNRDK